MKHVLLNRPLCIISLTSAGDALAKRIIAQLPSPQQYQHLHCPKPFTPEVQSRFMQGHAFIFICATGIVIRTLAPVLNHKQTDPPILVLDDQARFVIPLLSGHEGGANAWAQQLAQKLTATAVLTTANLYLEPIYVLGMGCERHCPTNVLRALKDQVLLEFKQQTTPITALASIDLKTNETGLCELAAEMNIPFVHYPAKALRTTETRLSTHSAYVLKTVGCYGVAEAAALLHADRLTQKTAELVITKQKNAQATIALARAYLT